MTDVDVGSGAPLFVRVRRPTVEYLLPTLDQGVALLLQTVTTNPAADQTRLLSEMLEDLQKRRDGDEVFVWADANEDLDATAIIEKLEINKPACSAVQSIHGVNFLVHVLELPCLNHSREFLAIALLKVAFEWEHLWANKRLNQPIHSGVCVVSERVHG